MKPKTGTTAAGLLTAAAPALYSLVFHLHLFFVTDNVRLLIRPAIVTPLVALLVVWIAVRRASGDYRSIIDPAGRDRFFSVFHRYNKWIVAAALALLTVSARFEINSFVYPVFIIYVLLLLKDGIDTRAPGDTRDDCEKSADESRGQLLIKRLFFYCGIIYVYVLLGTFFKHLMNPLLAAPAAAMLALAAIAQSSLFSVSTDDAPSRSSIRKTAAAASLAALYLLALHFLITLINLSPDARLLAASIVLFVPVFLLEKTAESLLEKSAAGAAKAGMFRLLKLFTRFAFLFAFFYLWTLYPIRPDPKMAWTQSHMNYALKALSLFPLARPKVALATGAALIVIYLLLWVWLRRGRVLLAVAAPVGFMLICYVFFYWDIAGGKSELEVLRQPGVSIVYDFVPTNEKIGLNHSMRFPRAIRTDPDAKKIFVSFGSIYGNSTGSPSLMSVRADGKDPRFLDTPHNGKTIVRDFHLENGADDFFFCTWGFNYLLTRVNRDSFSVIKNYSFAGLDGRLGKYDAYDVIPQTEKNRVFLVTGQPPAVVRFNLDRENTPGFADILDLYAAGIAEFGAILHKIEYDPRRNVLLTVAITGKKNRLLLEIDPDRMTVLRRLILPEIVISVKPDPVRNEILLGCGLKKRMISVDTSTFKIKKRHNMPVSTIRNFIVDPEKDRVYIVDHLGGRVLVMNRDLDRVLISYFTGNKPLGIDRIDNSLFVASTIGIIRIDLDLTEKEISAGTGAHDIKKSAE